MSFLVVYLCVCMLFTGIESTCAHDLVWIVFVCAYDPVNACAFIILCASVCIFMPLLVVQILVLQVILEVLMCFAASLCASPYRCAWCVWTHHYVFVHVSMWACKPSSECVCMYVLKYFCTEEVNLYSHIFMQLIFVQVFMCCVLFFSKVVKHS